MESESRLFDKRLVSIVNEESKKQKPQSLKEITEIFRKTSFQGAFPYKFYTQGAMLPQLDRLSKDGYLKVIIIDGQNHYLRTNLKFPERNPNQWDSDYR